MDGAVQLLDVGTTRPSPALTTFGGTLKREVHQMARKRGIDLEQETSLKPLELAQAARRSADETDDPSRRLQYLRLFSRLFDDWRGAANRERTSR